MKRAVIDIGTNSVLMLIAEQSTNGQIQAITDQAKTARLGEGLAATGLLSDTAMARTLAILQGYAEAIATEVVSEVICFGTAALRRAENAQDFIGQVKQQLGWTVRVLSGEEEAEYTFAGVMTTTSPRQETAIAIDIGGGSTEVVYGSRPQGITFQQSFPVGAVTLKDQFQLNDTIPTEQQEAVLADLHELFQHLEPANDRHVLFTGGTATTMPALQLRRSAYEELWQLNDTFVFSSQGVEKLYQKLNQLSLEARSQLHGMEPGRADIILPALLILKALLNKFWPENPPLLSLTCTARGARYGILLQQP